MERTFKNVFTKVKKYIVESEGWINYRGNTCVLEIPKPISDYYRSLIPKYLGAKSPKYSPHITIVREWEKPNEEFLNKPYNGCIFSFCYCPKIQFDGKYFYLNCHAKIIKQMRQEFGLETYRMNNCYHFTIGNVK